MATQYITVVLALPENQQQRMQVVDTFKIDGHFMGAHITALSLGDVISEAEQLEQLVPPDALQRIQQGSWRGVVG